MARAVRGATRAAGDGAQVRVAEMMPAPEQLWLYDEAGERYTAELRLVAVDRSAAALRST